MTVDKNQALMRLNESPNAAYMKVDFEEQTAAEKVYHLIWELEAEVNNGGFAQYFANSSGDYAIHVVAALRAIGANAAADIAQRAIAIVFGSLPPPMDREQREATLARIAPSQQEDLNACDNAFFKYPDNLTNLLYDYIAANRSTVRGAETFVQSS